jgi:glycosyltransferase involved in cell wall biosynthesis
MYFYKHKPFSMLPLLTVLMPNYNNAPFLKEAIDSILDQTFKDFIFLIVDDGSTDNSVDIIKSYGDHRIKLILKEKNSGIVDTLNTGLEQVDTRYIVRMDGDDRSVPERLETLFDFMEKNPEVGICGSQMQYFGNQHDTTHYFTDKNKLKAQLIYSGSVSHPSVIIRTQVLRSNHILYRNTHPYMEDYDLFFRLKDKTSFANIDKVLYQYRLLSHNSTVKNYHTRLDRYRIFFNDVLTELDIDPNQKNIELHLEFFVHPATTFGIEEYRNWMNYLMLQNKKKNIYPQKELEELFIKKWEQLFFKIVPRSLNKTFDYFYLSKKIRKDQLSYLLKFKINRLIGRNQV